MPTGRAGAVARGAEVTETAGDETDRQAAKRQPVPAPKIWMRLTGLRAK